MEPSSFTTHPPQVLLTLPSINTDCALLFPTISAQAKEVSACLLSRLSRSHFMTHGL